MIESMKVGSVFLLVLFVLHSQAQSQKGRTGNTSHGSLAVTATVDSSVWLFAGPDGKQQVIVANAPDPKQSFFRSRDAVQFTFPESPRRFELKNEIVTSKFEENGRIVQRSVQVTTVVAK
ncbi:MAG TPA: hypothetical protein VFR84_07520 [Candidatus Angelobacter sp.]|nr:hypothetical protein [Candidatus Angelobacter sp.]